MKTRQGAEPELQVSGRLTTLEARQPRSVGPRFHAILGKVPRFNDDGGKKELKKSLVSEGLKRRGLSGARFQCDFGLAVCQTALLS